MQWPSPPVARRPLARAALCLALLSLPPAAAQADGESPDELDRWVPALGLSIQVHGQKASGSVTSSQVLGTPLTDGGCLQQNGTRDAGELCDQSGAPLGRAPIEIVPDSSSSDVGVAMAFGASLELMTPRLTERFYSPRLFAHADATLALAFERNLAGERSPGKLRAPKLSFGLDPREISFQGQGSRAKSEVQPFLFSAGVGSVFTTQLFDRVVRLKPSVEYLWQEQKIIGIAHRLVKLENDQIRPTPDLEDFRRIELDGERIEEQHGLGAGLELEADAGRIGPILFSPFIWGRAYRVLNETEYELVVSNSDPDGRAANGLPAGVPDGTPESVSYKFDFDPWVWRAGIGIRLRFVPQ